MELGTELGTETKQSRNNKNKDNKDKNLISIVFDHWMSKGLVKHRKLTPHIELQIKYKSNDYSLDEILDAITNYDLILNDPSYKLSTRWGIEDFMNKGHFEKFLSDRDPFNFYPMIGRELQTASKQSKLSKNRDKLLGGAVMGRDGTGSQVSSVQGVGGLPEPDRTRR